MKSELEIETEKPGELKQILELSLEDNQKVNYNLSTEEEILVVKTETDGLGPLRGCTDTVFRLASLADKLY